MTFRAKPVVKRDHRPSWESRDRRNFYLNLGFGLVVAVALLILVVAVALSYYNDHLVSVGSVNDRGITKDQLADRVVIENWRLEEAQRRVRTQTVAGRLTQSQADLQNQIIEQQRQQIVGISLERIIDNLIQSELATQEGVTVTDADIDARLVEEATVPESRHAWVIEVEPEVDEGAIEPTAEQVAAARTKAEAALRDLRDGKAWDDVAKTVSTDTATAPQAGDLGWLQDDDAQTDEALLTALFEAEVDSPTDVIEGEDGIFRIGRVSEIAAESVDGAYQDKIVNDGLDLAKYREVVRGDVIRRKLEDTVVAEATKEDEQRQVLEIYMSEDEADLPPTAVKVRHILYSPNDDPEAASAGEIAEDDPAWAAAEAEAKAAFDKLTADPTQFDTMARSESDESSARGVTGTGGKLPGYITETSGYVDEFKTAVLVPGLEDGDVLEPFRTAFGWHVVQVMSHPPGLDVMESLKRRAEAGEDFGALAREWSESESAGRGGELGWIAKAQLDQRLIAQIFLTEVGAITDVTTIGDDGYYLYKVLAKEVRTPEGRQLEEIRDTAFGDWYQEKKDTYRIYRDEVFLAGG
jgi:parvulin-like peptidyl-prolyl isomerase